MKSTSNTALGRKGEEAAIRFLQSRGYEILASNWKCRFGEADIICDDLGTLVFIEVKTRTNIDKGLPEEAVNADKRSRYEKIAAAYLTQSDKVDISVRFDIISILALEGGRALLRHHINAFGA